MGLTGLITRYRLLLFSLMGLISCNISDLEFDGIEPINYTPEVAVAVANANYTLVELITDSGDSAVQQSEAPNGLITLSYLDTAQFVFTGSDLTTILNNPSAQLDVQLQDRFILLDLFDEFESGQLIFNDPQLTFVFDNSLGIPFGVFVDEVNTLRVDSTDLSEQRGILDGIITDAASTVSASEDPGNESERTSIIIRPDNSNISDIFSFAPFLLNTPLRATTNPLGEAITGNVAAQTASVDIQTRLDLPLEVIVDSLVTLIDFDMNDGLSFEEADSVTLRITTVNDMPLEGLLVMQFFDLDSMMIYEVPENVAFAAARVGSRDRTEDIMQNIDDIALDSLGLEALKNTTFINSYVTLNSYRLDRRDVVSFFSDYTLDITVSAIVTVDKEL